MRYIHDLYLYAFPDLQYYCIPGSNKGAKKPSTSAGLKGVEKYIGYTRCCQRAVACAHHHADSSIELRKVDVRVRILGAGGGPSSDDVDMDGVCHHLSGA